MRLWVYLALALCVGCGDSNTSGKGATATNGANGTTGGTNGGGGGDGGTADLSGAVNPDAKEIDRDAACATSSAAATRLPVDLVFMFDRSDSMNTPNKWPPCAAGLKAFFADPMSAGLSASIQFFCGGANCATLTTQWSTPVVPLTPLPDPTDFAMAIDAQTFCSGTPTNPALAGALNYARMIQMPGRKTAVVLVTDGEPTRCGSLQSVVNLAAAAVAPPDGGTVASIPTYVIGVGGSLTNLNDIAMGGGTNQAILVATTNPTQVAQDFQNALNAIRGSTLSCTYGIPTPPAGQTLDFSQVNVELTTGGTANGLLYDATCASGTGWRYDDPTAPTQIELCPTVCDTVKADAAAQVEVLFGCATTVS